MGPINGQRQILAKRVSPLGQVLDAAPIDVAGDVDSALFEPAVVYTASAHMVVWHSATVDGEVRGALVSPDGSVGTPFPIIDDLRALYPQQMNGFLSRPHVALASDRVMVTVEPRFAFDVRQPTRPVYAQILDLNGNRQLADPMLVREDTGDNPRYVQVASDGQSFLVTWVEGLLETNTISSGLFGIFARQISTAGQLINGTAADTGLEIESVPDLPIEELNTSIINGEYSVLWSSTSFGTDFGIYENTVSSDLSTITPAAPVSGTRDAAPSTNIPRVSSPDVAASADNRLYVWPSRDGTIQAWRGR